MIDFYRQDIINFLNNNFNKTGFIDTNIPSLKYYTTQTTSEFSSIIYEPSLCIILQGSKAVSIGSDRYQYNISRYLLALTYIPANVKIIEASKDLPYMTLVLKFSTKEIYEVLKDTKIDNLQNTKKLQSSIFLDDITLPLIEPISRLVKLLDKPKDNIDFMYPLIKKEILYILLQSNSKDFLKHYVLEGSITNKIVQAISSIKDNFSDSINISQLAKDLDISESSLYHNFKKITMMSPIQYQKKIRLEEAKFMLLAQNIEASEVAFAVGYESPSQFSREYSRMFGLPPISHINYLKDNLQN